MAKEQKMTGFQIFVLGVLSAFGPLALDLYLPGLPMMQKELHTTASMAQLSITAAMIGLAVGQVLIGPLSDQIGRKKPLMIGILIFTLASGGIAVSQQIGVLIVLRLIQGLSGAAGIVLSLAMITDAFEGVRLTRNVAINQAINGMFPVLAPVLGGVLIGWLDWRSAFWFLTILGALLVIVIAFKLPETNHQRVKTSFREVLRSFKQVLMKRPFVVMMLIQAFMMSGLFAYIAGSSFVLQDMYGLSVPEFSGVYALNGLGLLLGAAISGKLADHYAPQTILKGFMAVSVFGGILLAISLVLPQPLWLILLAFFLIVAPIGGINSMTTAIAMQQISQDAGTASGLLGLMRFLMGGLMTPLVGLGGTSTMVPLVITIIVVQSLGVCFFIYAQRHVLN
ncbi:DHA1 family bicyclomycin/chloramphenicol resistance-like MFS transporter [Weissella uvarum]|uniref:multidrug effflux MFS transporter n=1 Tax=Weissella uvarum TaxID=1479233 RepID=UPI0019602947|nr:multidrug effflux MFS transporter [Weissella uvarum]MBM7617578.1 DHA1 family bicyclomycin/chloramphenicol resistance-like MFS transporter [Weissella uvarum]MCM0595540.1 multidrug effflux MFS transporter [Weissella uvarum]